MHLDNGYSDSSDICCDMRSHVVSEYVEGGSVDAEDVVRVSVEACPYRDMRGWVLFSRV